MRNPLIRNMAIVGGITLLAKGLSFYKEILVASFFGLSVLLDTYYIAILVPSFIQHVFIGALKSLFIPNYVIEQNTTKNIGSFQSFTLISITLLVVLLATGAIFFAEYFLDVVFPGHSVEYYEMIRIQIYIALPSLFFWGYSGFFSGLLDIESKYLVSNLPQLFMPVTVVVLLLFFKDYIGDYVLAVGFTLGSFLGFIYLIFQVTRLKLLTIKGLRINKNIKVMRRCIVVALPENKY